MTPSPMGHFFQEEGVDDINEASKWREKARTAEGILKIESADFELPRTSGTIEISRKKGITLRCAALATATVCESSSRDTIECPR